MIKSVPERAWEHCSLLIHFAVSFPTAFWLCSHYSFPTTALRLYCSVTARKCCFGFVSSPRFFPRSASHRLLFSSKHNDAFSFPLVCVPVYPSHPAHPVLNCWLHALTLKTRQRTLTLPNFLNHCYKNSSNIWNALALHCMYCTCNLDIHIPTLINILDNITDDFSITVRNRYTSNC